MEPTIVTHSRSSIQEG
uniref:Uncharacterized protein n=1 Tax=Arundo donax TaxID=35708 RepID=A0A0A9CIA8_ARUDO